MNCTQFTSWLENRDTYDHTEAHRAMKHAAQCVHCKDLLKGDGELDLFIKKMFQYEKMDERMYPRIELGLGSSPRKRGVRGGIAAACAMMAAFVLIYVFSPASGKFGSLDELGKHVVLDHKDHGRNISFFTEIENREKWALDNLNYSFAVNGMPIGNMKMIGGRVCIIKNCSFAHLIFEDDNQDLHSLFVVTGEEIRFLMDPGRVYYFTLEGVELRIWQQQKTVYALAA